MCSANAGRICQAWSTGIPFLSRHRGNWSLCESANHRDQTRQVQNHSRHGHSTCEGIWAGKEESLRLLSYTHWPQRSAFYGTGDTSKLSHHIPPAQTQRTQTALPPHLLLPLDFPVTRPRDVHICLVKDLFTFFHILVQ